MVRLLKINVNKPLDWNVCCEDFLTFKLAQGVTPRTIKDYQWHLGHFFQEYSADWGDYGRLKKAVLNYFAKGNHLAPATHNIRRKYLKCFFEWAVREEILLANPLSDIPLRREEPRAREIDEAKLKALVEICDTTTYSGLRDFVLLCLTNDLGIRPKEALLLVPEDFNLKGMEVRVPATIAKTRVSRTLPISPLTVDGVKKLILVRPDDWGKVPLFATAEGNAMDTHAWSLRLTRHGKKLGFKITAYDLRNAFALIVPTQRRSSLGPATYIGTRRPNYYQKVRCLNAAGFKGPT